MAKVVGVRFKDFGKVYYFDPAGMNFEIDERVIVETSRGVECGEIALEPKEVSDSEIVRPLKKIVRKATEADIKKLEENLKKEAEALVICEQKIAKHGLDMKLVDVDYTLDGSKILFYFTADGRVDFRELVKDLASVFHTRIELRQIGVRDEAKMLGGLGMCGRISSPFLSKWQKSRGFLSTLSKSAVPAADLCAALNMSRNHTNTSSESRPKSVLLSALRTAKELFPTLICLQVCSRLHSIATPMPHP